MRTPTSRALAAVALLLGGCVHAPPAATADPLGCWYFDRDASAAALNLPWGVELADEALAGWPALEQRGGARLARTLTPDGPEDHPFGYWMMEGDSLEVGYPGGGGLLLLLELGTAELAGVARPLGDAVAPGAAPRTTRPVRLTRAQCPS